MTHQNTSNIFMTDLTAIHASTKNSPHLYIHANRHKWFSTWMHAQLRVQYVCVWLCGACHCCRSHAPAGIHFNLPQGKDACSLHAVLIISKFSPPVGCWFWVVPRSMLLEAFTCWNCRWLGFWVGDWGWAGLEVWELSLEQVYTAQPWQSKLLFCLQLILILLFVDHLNSWQWT